MVTGRACPDCGSPSWRNGPCWFEHVARKWARDAGREFDLEAFRCGGDPPCAGYHYDENQSERRRGYLRGWLVFVSAVALGLLVIFALAGCGDSEWPQEKRQREAVNAPADTRYLVTLEDRIQQLEQRVDKLEGAKP